MPDSLADRRRSWLVVGLCAVGFVYVFPYYPTINNPNENVRHYMTAAIVEYGTYEISELRRRWGWVNDAAVYEGRVYSVKGPGSSLLAIPGYAAHFYGAKLFGVEPDRETSIWICRFTATMVPTLIFLFFFHRWLGRQTNNPLLRDATVISMALGSLLYGYAIIFCSHTVGAAIAFAAFMALHSARREIRVRPAHAFWAGLLASGATLFEYPALVITVPLCFYALVAIRPRRGILWFALGALIPTLIVMHFQWCAYDNPLTPGHLYVEDDFLRGRHEEGFYGAEGFRTDAALGLLFHPAFGMFPLTPLLIFAVIGFPVLIKREATRADALAAFACVGLTWLVISFMNNWRGGWTIGPRHLAGIVPFVAWAALVGLDVLAARWRRITASLAVGTTAAGLVASGLPSAYYPHFPQEITRPLGQVIQLLVDHDYAPHNAGHLLGWTGTWSMVPLFVLFGVTLVVIAWSRGWVVRDRAAVLAGACALGAVLVYPLFEDRDDPGVDQAVALITREWRPEGDDAAATLERELAERQDVDFEEYRTLADLYFSEGREREAREVMRRAQLRQHRQGQPR